MDERAGQVRVINNIVMQDADCLCTLGGDSEPIRAIHDVHGAKSRPEAVLPYRSSPWRLPRMLRRFAPKPIAYWRI